MLLGLCPVARPPPSFRVAVIQALVGSGMREKRVVDGLANWIWSRDHDRSFIVSGEFYNSAPFHRHAVIMGHASGHALDLQSL
jgi:hypothetical protein